MHTSRNQSAAGGGSYEPAETLLRELAGDVRHICIMMGVKKFYPLDPVPEKHLGGVAFRYSRKLVKNKSNLVRIYALPNGLRRMEWLHMGEFASLSPVESEDNIAPERMEEVWWKHTACAVRPPWILDCFKQKFQLGRTLMTPAAQDTFTEEELHKCLTRHSSGDWGDICAEDKRANDESLKFGTRLLSVYRFDDGRVLWIITEAEDDRGQRAATTMLLPDEY